MEPDPVVAEIRKIREKLLEEAGGDLHKMSENARRFAEEHGFKPLTAEEFSAQRAQQAREAQDVPPKKTKSA